MQRNNSNLAEAVFHWIQLDKLPDRIVATDYYKKQRKLGVTPIAAAAYLLHPKYKGYYIFLIEFPSQIIFVPVSY